MKSFDKLIKQSDKLALTKRFSSFYVRALKHIHSAVEVAYADKVIRKSLSTTGSKSLSALRQRLAKYVKSVSLDLSAVPSETDEDELTSESEIAAVDSDAAVDKSEKLTAKNKDFVLYAD